MHLVFWQPIPSFHQEGFLIALAQADWVKSVTLKYESELPESRRQSGWREGNFQGVKLEQIQALEVPVDTAAHIHIFTGLQTHPMVWAAFHQLPRVAQCGRFAFAEAPECIGWKGVLRTLKYKVASRRIAPCLDGMLALGQLGVDFYRSVLPRTVPVHTFAYYDVGLSTLPRFERPEATNNLPPTTPYRFLYVGQLIHRKGVDRLLAALAAVSSDAWKLTIVGEGSRKKTLQQQAARLGITAQLHWHGSLPSAELSTYYQQADCLVLPSRWDGWGMTVNESLRYGCDVLLTMTCGAASVFPQAAQLPRNSKQWTSYLQARLRSGRLPLEARVANQQRANSLSCEAGVARLKAVLIANVTQDRC